MITILFAENISMKKNDYFDKLASMKKGFP